MSNHKSNNNKRAELPHEFLSRYEPQKCFSHNAISETYLVKSLKNGKEYVAKIYDKFFVEGNNDESEILSRLNHPAIPKLIENIETDEVVCVVRDHVQGVTLDSLKIPVSERYALNIGKQLCDILTYLHTQSPPIIHRDIKPSNVIINSENKIRLIDFDISRQYNDTAVKDTTLVATDGFSPPEQYGFKQTDTLADIYSFGCLMCWLLTGSNDITELDKIKNRTLVNVIRKCAAFSPNDRYKSARIVKSALVRACKNKNRRNFKAVVGVLAVIVGLAFAGGFALGRLTAPIFEIPEIEQEFEISVNSRMEEYAAEAVRLFNIERVNHGLPELLSDNHELNSFAMIRAIEASEGYQHQRPDGSYVGFDSELHFSGQQSPQEYVNSLKNSEYFDRVILRAGYTHIAIGVAAKSDENLNWVLFVRGEWIDEIPDVLW